MKKNVEIREVDEEGEDYANDNILDDLISDRYQQASETRYIQNAKPGSQTEIGNEEVLNNFSSKASKQVVIEPRSSSEYSFSSESEASSEDEFEREDDEDYATVLFHKQSFGYSVETGIKEIEKEHKKAIEEIKSMKAPGQFETYTDYKIGEERPIKTHRYRMVKPNLQQALINKFGDISAFSIANGGKLLAVAFASKKFIFGFFPEGRDIFEFKEFKIDISSPISSISFDEQICYMIVGHQNGNLMIYKYNPIEIKLGLLSKNKAASNTEIYQCIALGDRAEAIVFVDSECRIMYSLRKNVKDNDKMYDFELVDILKRDTFPRIDVFHANKHDYLAFTAGDTLYLYTYNKLKRENLKKHVEIEFKEPLLKSSVPMFGLLKKEDRGLFYYLAVTKSKGIIFYRLSVEKKTLKARLSVWREISFSTTIISASKFEYNIFGILDNEGSFYYYLLAAHAEANEEEDTENKIHHHMLMPRTQGADLSNVCESEDSILEIMDDEIARLTESSKKTKPIIMLNSPFLIKKHEGFNIDVLIPWEDRLNRVSIKTKFVFNSTSQILILSTEGYCKFEMIDWKDYLTLCLENKEYVICIKTLYSILDRQETELRGIPNNLQELIEETQTLIEVIFSKMIPKMLSLTPETQNYLIKYGMNLLLKTGMQEYLVFEYKDIMESFGFKKQFLSEMRCLFESQRLPLLEKEIVNDIYSEIQESKEERQKFLMMLHERGYGFEILINNCISKKDYDLLMLFSSRFDPELSLVSLQVLQSEVTQQRVHGNDKVATEYLQMQFWYVNSLLQAKRYDSQCLMDHVWQMLSWIFDSNSIKACIKTDITTYLKSLFFLFKEDLVEILKEVVERWEDKPLFKLKHPAEVGILREESSEYLKFLFNTIFHTIEPSDALKFDLFLVSLVIEQLEGIILTEDHLQYIVKRLVNSVQGEIEEYTSEFNLDFVCLKLFALFLIRPDIFKDTEIKETIEFGE